MAGNNKFMITRARARPRGKPRRKGVRRSMIMTKGLNFNNYFFKRKVQLTGITLSNLSDTFGALTFKLSDLPSSTEITNLFDRYRILKVGVVMVPNWTNVDANPSTTLLVPNPQIFTAIDYTDASVPLNFNELYEDSQCKITRGGKVHKRVFTPAFLASGYESVTTAAYSPKWKQWLTTDDPSAPHYCLKYGINAAPAANVYRVSLYVTYYFQCKDLK